MGPERDPYFGPLRGRGSTLGLIERGSTHEPSERGSTWPQLERDPYLGSVRRVHT